MNGLTRREKWLAGIALQVLISLGGFVCYELWEMHKTVIRVEQQVKDLNEQVDYIEETILSVWEHME